MRVVYPRTSEAIVVKKFFLLQELHIFDRKRYSTLNSSDQLLRSLPRYPSNRFSSSDVPAGSDARQMYH